MDSISTTRIDLQKLQLLNDRICQCLDALNQVRLSAHASNFAPVPQFHGQSFYGAPIYGNMNYQQPYAYNTPYAFGGFNTMAQPWNVPAFSPVAQYGYQTPVNTFANPWQTSHAGLGPVFSHPTTSNGHLSSAPYSIAW